MQFNINMVALLLRENITNWMVVFIYMNTRLLKLELNFNEIWRVCRAMITRSHPKISSILNHLILTYIVVGSIPATRWDVFI